MNNEFGSFLETTMNTFNGDNNGTDNIAAVRGKLDAVKGVMVYYRLISFLYHCLYSFNLLFCPLPTPLFIFLLFLWQVQNIESILERGEKLELLVDKTDQLQTQAFQFQSQSKKLKNAMLMRKIKMYAAIAGIILVIIWVISAVACGIDYSKCGNDKKK